MCFVVFVSWFLRCFGQNQLDFLSSAKFDISRVVKPPFSFPTQKFYSLSLLYWGWISTHRADVHDAFVMPCLWYPYSWLGLTCSWQRSRASIHFFSSIPLKSKDWPTGYQAKHAAACMTFSPWGQLKDFLFFDWVLNLIFGFGVLIGNSMISCHVARYWSFLGCVMGRHCNTAAGRRRWWRSFLVWYSRRLNGDSASSASMACRHCFGIRSFRCILPARAACSPAQMEMTCHSADLHGTSCHSATTNSSPHPDNSSAASNTVHIRLVLAYMIPHYSCLLLSRIAY